MTVTVKIKVPPQRPPAAAVGDRVRLIRTNYVHSDSDGVTPGDQGILTDITELPMQLWGKKQFWVKWDKTGSNIALIEGEDEFQMI